jgi:predicted ATPase
MTDAKDAEHKANQQLFEQMFRHLEVTTYPGGRRVELRDLPQVSWFVGPNGAGKSQALKAVFTHLDGLRSKEILSTVALIPSDRVHAGLLPNDNLGVSEYSMRSSTAHTSASLTTAIALLQDDASLEIAVRATAQTILQRELRLDFGALAAAT